MKKIRFSDVVTVYEVGNSEEDQSARNGLQDTANHYRFQTRIKNTETIIKRILLNKIKKMFFDHLPQEYI